ncbi:hypothetical protein JXA84_00575, partial [candidate division WOR-3 bacterium]|nr:hypothetical protein [candidate division WOR-3 bacterium]
MYKILLPILFTALFSCSGQVPESVENAEFTQVLDRYFAFIDVGDYEGAVEMLTPLTIEKLSDNIEEHLHSIKQIVDDDSLLKNKMIEVYGISLEEVLSKNDTQLIALYFQKIPKYFELDRNFVIEAEQKIDSLKAFVTVRYQNNATDTIFFEKHGNEWKIDLSFLVQTANYRVQVLENAHSVQLAAEEFLFFADSRGYPLTIEEMN